MRDDQSRRLQCSHEMSTEIANLYFLKKKKNYNSFHYDVFHLISISDVGGKTRKSRFREVRCVYCVCKDRVRRKKKKYIAALKCAVPSFGGGLDWCSLPGPRKPNCMFLSSSSSLNPQSPEKKT